MNNNTQNNTLRILFDISRSLSALERLSINTDKKLTQIHTMLLADPHFHVSPIKRRSKRLALKKTK